MTLLSFFCSRENLPKVTKLLLGESGFEPRVEALSSHVIHSLYKTITAKQIKRSSSKYSNNKYNSGHGEKVLQKQRGKHNLLYQDELKDVSTEKPFLSWALRKEFTQTQQWEGHFRYVWKQTGMKRLTVFSWHRSICYRSVLLKIRGIKGDGTVFLIIRSSAHFNYNWNNISFFKNKYLNLHLKCLHLKCF